MDNFNFNVYDSGMGNTHIKSFDNLEQYFQTHHYTWYGKIFAKNQLNDYVKQYIENIPLDHRTSEMNSFLETFKEKVKLAGGEGSLFDQRIATQSKGIIEIVSGLTLLTIGLAIISFTIYMIRKNNKLDNGENKKSTYSSSPGSSSKNLDQKNSSSKPANPNKPPVYPGLPSPEIDQDQPPAYNSDAPPPYSLY